MKIRRMLWFCFSYISLKCVLIFFFPWKRLFFFNLHIFSMLTCRLLYLFIFLPFFLNLMPPPLSPASGLIVTSCACAFPLTSAAVCLRKTDPWAGSLQGCMWNSCWNISSLVMHVSSLPVARENLTWVGGMHGVTTFCITGLPLGNTFWWSLTKTS